MTRLPAVLLDANAYRKMGQAQFDALFEAERRRGVARYCDPFVVAEFLAHLADPTDPDFPFCRGAVGRVYRRCNVSTGGECGILRDSESRMAEFINGKGLERHDAYTEEGVAPPLGDHDVIASAQTLPSMEQTVR